MEMQIPDGLVLWVQELAAKAGQSPEEFAREALVRACEDREDYETAVEASRKIASGEMKLYSYEEVMRDLGLDD